MEIILDQPICLNSPSFQGETIPTRKKDLCQADTQILTDYSLYLKGLQNKEPTETTAGKYTKNCCVICPFTHVLHTGLRSLTEVPPRLSVSSEQQLCLGYFKSLFKHIFPCNDIQHICSFKEMEYQHSKLLCQSSVHLDAAQPSQPSQGQLHSQARAETCGTAMPQYCKSCKKHRLSHQDIADVTHFVKSRQKRIFLSRLRIYHLSSMNQLRESTAGAHGL